jgi:hypothetical protein
MPRDFPRPDNPEGRLMARWLTAARRQGFLALVPPDSWHALSAVLSFTCRDGRRRFTLDQLALALAVPRAEAARRMEGLARTQWRGQPLAVPESGPDGEVAGAEVAPVELLLSIDTGSAAPPPLPAAGPAPLPPPDGLRAELEAAGLRPEQADRLLAAYPAERLRRQLGWLPRRAARNPAAFLVKAVEGDWDEPKEGR